MPSALRMWDFFCLQVLAWNPCCYVPLLIICFTRLDVLFHQLRRNHSVCAVFFFCVGVSAEW